MEKHLKNIIKVYKSSNGTNVLKQNLQKINMPITYIFYSTIYYNSDIWHLPSLNLNLKHNIRSASVIHLNFVHTIIINMSYDHSVNNKAQHSQILKYKLSQLGEE
jgi:hypothetical protein